MTSAPKDTDQFLKRIDQVFSAQIARNFAKYFQKHKFDEWEDIVDDIINGYDDCCCKEILFKLLNITNIKQQQNIEYLRLKQCLNPPIFSQIFTDIINVYTIIFDTNFAENIVTVFDKAVNHYINTDYIDDVKHIESSIIISYIINNIDYNQIHQNKKFVINMIANGIQSICQRKTEQFMQHHHLQEITDSIQAVIKRLDAYFVNTFNDKEIGHMISKSFEYVINEEEFENIETVRDDIDDVDDSIILQYIIEQIEPKLNPFNKQNEIIMIKTKVHEIIMSNNTSSNNCNHIAPKQENSLHDQISNKISLNKTKEKNHKSFRNRLMMKISDEYDKNIATKIVNAINEIIIEEKYDLETLRDDVEDIDNSDVLSKLDEFEEISSYYCYEQIKITIREFIIQRINVTNFNILLFDLDVTQKDINNTETLIAQHCQTIYKHCIGIQLTSCNEQLPSIAGRSLTIAKSIDIKNSKPILYWLLKLYSKERTAKYRDGLSERYAYNISDWWLENNYCQWIQKMHPKRATDIKIGIAELTKRALPMINYHSYLFPVICDQLNDVAQYVLAFHEVAYRMKRLIHMNDMIDYDFYMSCPIQIDYWIIPQMTRSQQSNNIFAFGNKYNTLSQNAFDSNAAIWNIEDILNHPKLGHIEGKDYWIENGTREFEKLHSKLYHMIAKAQKWGHHKQQPTTSDIRRNRYIFIIDRRNPHNIENQNLSIKPTIDSKKTWPDKIYLIKPKQYRNETGQPLCICGVKLIKVQKSIITNINAKCGWCQHLIRNIKNNQLWECPDAHSNGYYLCSDLCQKSRPNTYGKLPKQCEILPESCLGLSANHILYNTNSTYPVPITLNSSLNGYKIGFSYHLLSEDITSVYLYLHAGSMPFELNDMKWAFSRWFEKRNGKPQKLNQYIIAAIDRDNDTLSDIPFDAFVKQVNNIDLDSSMTWPDAIISSEESNDSSSYCQSVTSSVSVETDERIEIRNYVETDIATKENLENDLQKQHTKELTSIGQIEMESDSYNEEQSDIHTSDENETHISNELDIPSTNLISSQKSASILESTEHSDDNTSSSDPSCTYISSTSSLHPLIASSDELLTSNSDDDNAAIQSKLNDEFPSDVNNDVIHQISYILDTISTYRASVHSKLEILQQQFRNTKNQNNIISNLSGKPNEQYIEELGGNSDDFSAGNDKKRDNNNEQNNNQNNNEQNHDENDGNQDNPNNNSSLIDGDDHCGIPWHAPKIKELESKLQQEMQYNSTLQIELQQEIEYNSTLQIKLQQEIEYNSIIKTDKALGLYYKRMDKNGYFDEGDGLFLKFVTNQKLNDIKFTVSQHFNDDIKPQNSIWNDFDLEFPFPLFIDIDTISVSEEASIIFGIIKYCHHHHIPPSDQYIEQNLCQFQREQTELTVIDGLYQYMQNIHIASEKEIKRFERILVEEEYDSEALEMDVSGNHYHKSNIGKFINNTDEYRLIQQYMQQHITDISPPELVVNLSMKLTMKIIPNYCNQMTQKLDVYHYMNEYMLFHGSDCYIKCNHGKNVVIDYNIRRKCDSKGTRYIICDKYKHKYLPSLSSGVYGEFPLIPDPNQYWKTRDKLYTATEIEEGCNISIHQLPKPNEMKSILMTEAEQTRQQIENALKNNDLREELIKSKLWTRIPISGKTSKSKAKIISLQLEQHEYVKRVRKFANKNVNNINLMLIVTHNGIENAWIVEIETDINIAITLKLGKKNKKRDWNPIIPTGIYLDINVQHKLVPYQQHKCQCLNNFICNIDHLNIGHDEKKQMVQKIKTLQKKLNDAKEHREQLPRKSLHISVIDIPSVNNTIYPHSSLESKEEEKAVISTNELTSDNISEQNNNETTNPPQSDSIHSNTFNHNTNNESIDDIYNENDEEKQEEIIFEDELTPNGPSENNRLSQENTNDQTSIHQQQFQNKSSNDQSSSFKNNTLQHKLSVAEDYIKLLEKELKKANTTIDKTNDAVLFLQSQLLQKQNETETFIQLLLQQQASLEKEQNQQKQMINALKQKT